MSARSTHTGPDLAAVSGARRTIRPPLSHRLLVALFPRAFRREFGDQILSHLSRQRAEPRYAGGVARRLRFWREAIGDAIASSMALRADRIREIGARSLPAGLGGSTARDDEYLLPGVDLRRPARERTEMMLDGILRDVRHAVRGLAKNRGYACVFIVTLGLGIGANTAMFSAVNGVLLRPLPHEDGDRLVYLRHTAPLGGIENALFSVPEIEDYRRGTPS
ncbi:MAG: hypothetical protein R3195_08655, partial [Gemmatimonadota bacterium]|nr:hypothetical protein [Gemmatimonadota bacterium]